MKVDLGKKLYCHRCGWEWLPRQEEVIRCARCKSPYWNSPRRDGKQSRSEPKN